VTLRIQSFRSPLVVAWFMAVIVGLGILGLRTVGLLEGLELGTYDWYMRLRPGNVRADSRIVLVTVTEQDIPNQGGWPLSDGILARAMEIIGRDGPRAIGLDMYRDVPVAPGTDALNALLSRDRRVVAVTKFAEGASTGVRPPSVLAGTDQVGFNDIIVDPGGVVRRGLLFLDDGTSVIPSFALQLALRYLQPEGIAPTADPHDETLLRLGGTTIRPLEPNDGGYIGADTRGYQFLLDFHGALHPFASVNLTTLLTGKAPPGLMRDKLVLIGVTAESIKDDFYTPFSRGLSAGQYISGVSVHAHIASQLLRMALEGARPMATRPESQEALWILLWSSAGAVVALRVRSPWRLGLAIIGGLVALGIADFVAFERGWWLPLVPPAMAWLAVAGGVTAWVSYQQTVQRGMLMQLFSRHVSKEVAETIWRQREEFLDGRRPRSQHLKVTALFTDLTGYTTVSEKHPADMLMEWLNEYMDVMSRQVAAHGGVIRQYAGDSIVALFGVPVARSTEADIEQDAVNAAECALAMASALGPLNKRWRSEGRPMAGMRIGIFTGPAVAGTIGSADRSEYVVVGDTMNTASRLESFDKDLLAPDPETRPFRILIGETTLRYLGGRFQTERVGDVSLKGKAQTVSVYALIGPAPAPADASRQEDDDEAPGVDRTAHDLHRRDPALGSVSGNATGANATGADAVRSGSGISAAKSPDHGAGGL
jgi:adenylate cyclase